MLSLKFAMTALSSAVLFASLLAQPAMAQRTIRAPEIGPTENAPDTVYYEKDYFEYVDERLYQMDEPSLWKMSKDPNLESYRFSWVPDGGGVHVIRIDVDAQGKAILTHKLSTGVTDVDWGTVASTQTRELTEKELKDLMFRFNFMAYWHVKIDDPEDLANTQGPLWLFEAIHKSKYHAVHRTNPAFGETRKFGLVFLSFIELGEADVAWPLRPTSRTPPPISDAD